MALRFGSISNCNKAEIRRVNWSQVNISIFLHSSGPVILFRLRKFLRISAQPSPICCRPGCLARLRHLPETHGKRRNNSMAVFHDEVEIEDFEYDEESETYFYPCPCGDQFEITKVCKVPLM